MVLSFVLTEWDSGAEAVLFEFCDLVEISLDDDVTEYMEDFVAWSMQSEHGDLNIEPNLGSWRSDAEFPPLSAVGKRLLASDSAVPLIESLAQKAGSNIALARLRLEDIHNEVQEIADRLPRSLVSLFDAEVSHLQNQHPDAASLGLKTVLLGTLSLDSPFETVKSELHSFVGRPENDVLTLDEVLHASGGLVTAKPITSEDLDGYHPDFYLYVTENYNVALFQERQAVQLRRISRSRTSLISNKAAQKGSYFVREVVIDEEEYESEDEDSIGDFLGIGKVIMTSQRFAERPPIKRSTWS